MAGKTSRTKINKNPYLKILIIKIKTIKVIFLIKFKKNKFGKIINDVITIKQKIKRIRR
jgi:hypothetical protein